MWGAKRSLSLLTSSASYLVYATIVSKMGTMLVLRKGLNPLIYIPHHVAMHSLRQCTHMTTRLTTPWLDACFRARQAEAKAHVQPSSVLWVVSVEGDDGDTHSADVMSTGVIHRILCAAGTSWRDALPCFPPLSNSAVHTSSGMITVSPPCSYAHDCCDLSAALDPAAHVYPTRFCFQLGQIPVGQEKLAPLSFLRSKDATQDLGESSKQPRPLLADSEEDM